MPKTEFVVGPGRGEGRRLDVVLAERVPELARSQVKRLVDGGAARVSGAVRRSSYKLRAGDSVAFDYKVPGPERLEPEDIPLKVLYADGDIIVIDKPAGLVVHPGAGNASGTLVNGLLHRFPEIATVGAEDRPGIVHRLDKDTSGVMVAARSARAYESLTRQFRTKDVWKTYLGLVWGQVTAPEGRIAWPIGRHASDGRRISVRSRHGKDAETFFRVLRVFKDTTLLEIKPTTGRTHQIRVHLAAAGHPVAGDPLYGRKKPPRKFPRLFLHAHILSFLHPATGKRLEFASPLPPELEAVLAELASF
ncbi:MAG TPA: RluA family pseudouridine synthase [Terriglobales bacterium]|nr:RluA family pseudouridine synthase [Terriglobales bacterium]